MRMLILLTVAILIVGCTKEEKTMTLLQAVQQHNVEQVRTLLKQGYANIDETNDKGETPLLLATHANDVDIAKLLIDAGADVNKQDNIQDSAYLYAGAQGKTDILAYMLAHAKTSEDVYNRYGGNTLIPAAEKGHIDNVKLLLADGRVNMDHQNNFGYTALIEAVALTDGSKLYQDIVNVLLNYGANTELRDNNGKTALDYAKERGYVEMVEMLNK